MIILFIWMLVFSGFSWYYSFQALENRKEEYMDKPIRVMMLPLNKYLTEEGLKLKRKALIFASIDFIGFIIIVLLITLNVIKF